MAEKIDNSGNAVIDNIKLKQQMSHPSSPASGYELLYIMSGTAHGGLFVKDSAGREIGPFLTGTASSGGAPTTVPYVTTASDATLSAEVVIPGLAASQDILGSNGAGVAYEFDSGVSPLTWASAVDTENVNSTVKSHLFVEDNSSSANFGMYSWSPAGAFDIRCKLSVGCRTANGDGFWAALVVGDSAMNNRCLLLIFKTPGTWQVIAYTYAGSYVQRGITLTMARNFSYLRITRDGSNNVSFWASSDGISYYLIATQSFTFTCGKAGLGLECNGTNILNIACDWIRSDV